MIDEENGKNARQLVIAKIPTLLVLDSAAVRSVWRILLLSPLYSNSA